MIADLKENVLTITFEPNEMSAVQFVVARHSHTWFSDLLQHELKRRTAQQVAEQKELIWSKLQKHPELMSQILKAE